MMTIRVIGKGLSMLIDIFSLLRRFTMLRHAPAEAESGIRVRFFSRFDVLNDIYGFVDVARDLSGR